MRQRCYDLDNRWVVQYSPYLCEKYNCHTNVKCVFSIQAVKYLYKYILKGSDMANVRFTTTENQENVVSLTIHLLLQQNVVYHAGTEHNVVEGGEPVTTLTAWFNLNATDEEAQQYPYQNIPLNYVWDKEVKTWSKRIKDHNTIGRLYSNITRSVCTRLKRVLRLK